MADELILYTNPMSRGRIARWMLEEVGQPYKTEVLDYASTMKGQAYLAINPMGKVPALRHGDAVITETAAICAYLADAFPQAGLAPPPGHRLRAPYYRWLFFAAGPIEDGLPPDEICAKLSRLLYRRTPPEKYATAVVAALALDSGVLRYANAGHNPPLVVRAGGERI